jgi:hypothetical protein
MAKTDSRRVAEIAVWIDNAPEHQRAALYSWLRATARPTTDPKLGEGFRLDLGATERFIEVLRERDAAMWRRMGGE